MFNTWYDKKNDCDKASSQKHIDGIDSLLQYSLYYLPKKADIKNAK